MEKENAAKDYKDKQDLFAIGAASQAEVDAAKDALDKAQRALDDIPNENGKAVLTSSENRQRQMPSRKPASSPPPSATARFAVPSAAPLPE